MPRDLGRVRGEDGRHFDRAQGFEDCVSGYSRSVQAHQRAAKRAVDVGFVGPDPGGAPSPFTVVCLRKVGELEVNREGFGDAVGMLDGQSADDLPRLRHQV